MDLTGGKEAEEGIDLERTDLAERGVIQVAAAGVVVGQVEAEVQEGGGGILHHIQADPHQDLEVAAALLQVFLGETTLTTLPRPRSRESRVVTPVAGILLLFRKDWLASVKTNIGMTNTGKVVEIRVMMKGEETNQDKINIRVTN